MSADNCIAICHTKDGYRVAHCQAIENIYWWYICCDKPNVIQTFEADISYSEQCLNCGTNNPPMEKRKEICADRLLEYFGNCKVFKTEEEAHREVNKLYIDIISDNYCPIIEYGIQSIEATHINLGDK